MYIPYFKNNNEKFGIDEKKYNHGKITKGIVVVTI